MKLRNKKTGEIIEIKNIAVLDDYLVLYQKSPIKGNTYYTLAELNEEWEDYEPKEPLIKDEKTRKAIKAWAEANGYDMVWLGYDTVSEPNVHNVQIHFSHNIAKQDNWGVHTIEELCGSEEIEILEPTYTTIEEKEKLKEKE